MKKLTSLILPLLGIFGTSFGQNEWMTFEHTQPSDTAILVSTLQYGATIGEVKVHADGRLEKIGAFLREGEESIEGVKIDGFRVLIYFDANKTMAEEKKARFMSVNPDHKTYVDYMAPNYRVRVGNFRTKLEAEALKATLLLDYPMAIVVKDKIQLPELGE